MSAMMTLVFCAPGYPGAAGDAQPFLDQFATAAVTAAGWPADSLTAVYDPSEQTGLLKLDSPSAALAFVPYPFYVQHGAQLHLAPLVQADVTGIGAEERWTLVAKSGGPIDAPSLAGFTLLSVAGYAPDFVRHMALGAWVLPADLNIESTGQLLSALRRMVAGEKVVVLLDQSQATSLPTLPFAAQLKTLVQSPPLPVALIAVVDSRLSATRAKTLQTALLGMSHAPGGAEKLAPLRLQGFILPQGSMRSAAP